MRFTIRDLLWLMVVVALVCIWQIDKSNAVTATKAAVKDVRMLYQTIYDPFTDPLLDQERKRLTKAYRIGKSD